jgi:hypothetical protein
MGETMITKDQQNALDVVVKAFGWDHMSTADIGLMLWSAFHYYVRRLGTTTMEQKK